MNASPPPDDGSVLGMFRTAPHNIEAEKALLGAIIHNNEAYYAVADTVRAEHFANEANATVFAACARLIDAGRRADAVTLLPLFQAGDGILADAGGPMYLADLMGSRVTVINAVEYGRIIAELARRRDIIGVAEAVATRGYTEVEVTAEALVEEIDAELARIAEASPDGADREPAEQMNATINAIEERRIRKGLPGRATGLIDLDNRIGGMEPGLLYVLAARPGMGKSALAINIAEHIARDVPILFVSLEMTAEQINRRRIAAWAEVDYGEIRRGEIGDSDAMKAHEAAARLMDVPFHIDERGGLSVAQIRRKALRIRRKARGLGLVVVDHIQLVRPDDLRAGRVHQVEQVTNGLKALAKELGVPVLALSQLNRGVENRDNKRPQLADLRESGAIEQDADAVMFLYREHYYLERNRPGQEAGEDAIMGWRADCEKIRRDAELDVAKQREDVLGVLHLVWRGEYQKFGNKVGV